MVISFVGVALRAAHHCCVFFVVVVVVFFFNHLIRPPGRVPCPCTGSVRRAHRGPQLAPSGCLGLSQLGKAAPKWGA